MVNLSFFHCGSACKETYASRMYDANLPILALYILNIYILIFQVTGPVCTMSSVDLQRMGSITYTLSVDDIGCLENLDDDAVASLGALMDRKSGICATFTFV